MTEIIDTGSDDSAQALQESLAELTASGSNQFDPVRFAFISALASRGSQRQPRVANSLHDSACKALERYQADLQAAREQAGLIAKNIADQFPGSGELAAQLLQSSDLKALERLQERLQARLQRQQKNACLTGLKDLINPHSATVEEIDPGKHSDGTQNAPELKSMRHLRESVGRNDAGMLALRAVRECPEDAGPLNPHRLVVRSLDTMRTISPGYLNRFVAYIDTLLWLDEAGVDPGADTGKAGATKASKKR